MTEIARLRATTYLRTMSTGRTCPSVFRCCDLFGQTAEYVVKPASQLGARVVCEALAALVGQQLGLPIPRIAAVEIEPRLVSVIPDPSAREKFTGKQQLHFGSLFQSGGYQTIPVGMRLPGPLMDMAIKIFAFDMLIQNPDRTNTVGRGKPNALCDGEQLIIFDHELAFSFLATIGSDVVPPPWELRQIGFARYHLFYDDLVRYAADKKGISFDGFLQGVTGLSEEIFNSMAGVLPSDWLNLDYVRRIVSYLTRARDNVQRLDQGLREALT